MHAGIFEAKILLFIIGFLFGGISSAMTVKYMLSRKILNLYNILNEANLQRMKLKKEQEKKMKVLREITKGIYLDKSESKNDTEPARYETLSSYLTDLNKLLDTVGISKIADTIPPSA